MEAGTNFEQAGQTAAHLDVTVCRISDSRNNFQQRAFTGAIAADNADPLALRDVEINVAQGPERLIAAGILAVGKSSKRTFQGFDEELAESLVPGLHPPDPLFLRKIPNFNNI